MSLPLPPTSSLSACLRRRTSVAAAHSCALPLVDAPRRSSILSSTLTDPRFPRLLGGSTGPSEPPRPQGRVLYISIAVRQRLGVPRSG